VERPADQRPLVFLRQSEGTTSSGTDDDAPVLTLPEQLMDDVGNAGWPSVGRPRSASSTKE
jgi:hypothetical protein